MTVGGENWGLDDEKGWGGLLGFPNCTCISSFVEESIDGLIVNLIESKN